MCDKNNSAIIIQAENLFKGYLLTKPVSDNAVLNKVRYQNAYCFICSAENAILCHKLK